MILDRGDYRSAGQGTYLATVALTLRQYTDAEKVLRGILAENPDRSERGNACYWLAHHLEQQAKLVRKLRANPDEMKDYAKYTARSRSLSSSKKKTPMRSTSNQNRCSSASSPSSATYAMTATRVRWA